MTLELLNRKAIPERIAENIKRILESKNLAYLLGKSTEETKEELIKSFIAEFHKSVKTAVNKTRNDSDILHLMNGIIQPSDEVMSSEDEIDMEVDK